MDCRFSSTNISIAPDLSSNKPKSYKLPTSVLNCKAQSKQESPTTSTQTQPQSSTQYNIKFQTLQACKLGISRYPDFNYNAKGGQGIATGKEAENSEELSVLFDVGSLYIPPLTGTTTRFLGLPLPPFLKIEIAPELFQGTINSTSGKVSITTENENIAKTDSTIIQIAS